MAITRPVPNANKTPTTSDDAAVEAFISGAPDSPKKPRGVIKGKRQQITLTMPPALLEKVDALAAELGQSRAAVINMAIYRAVEHGLTIDGLRKN
ncbi:ribbon-helix-helix domain-containing protein [Aromatoleum buckelii]|uniref:Ribbon-helix-helix protein, CopG family n=1 Tax=Aromatoleum buckelii TaxID=200254 RepID=A0ABX1N7W9_9RHOO|nr:ribbon-helix-helix domain-containing protein [Aromatoleum buckelii]MCK0509787.1 ribbon-helix-helix domain-containing protein [Aromatoleum buckelii]